MLAPPNPPWPWMHSLEAWMRMCADLTEAPIEGSVLMNALKLALHWKHGCVCVYSLLQPLTKTHVVFLKIYFVGVQKPKKTHQHKEHKKKHLLVLNQKVSSKFWCFAF